MGDFADDMFQDALMQEIILSELIDQMVETRTWITATGEEIPFSQLSILHIGHIIQMLLDAPDIEIVYPVIEALCEEHSSRLNPYKEYV